MTSVKQRLGEVMTKLKKGQAQEAEDPKLAYLAEAQGYHATFSEVVERARAGAAGKVDEEFVTRIDMDFQRLEEQIEHSKDDEMLKNLVDRAEELERLRAYVMPADEIELQARTCLADMRDWGVPRDVLSRIETDLLPAMGEKQSIEKRHGALHKVFDFYDAWENQVTEYDEWIAPRATWLCVLLGLSFLTAITGVVLGIGLMIFVAGGLAGSFASVLSRLPAMLGWGAWASLPARLYARVGLGVAGTLAGGGLMANGLLAIGQDSDVFPRVIGITNTATTAEGLYLAAVGILLGFSERLLSNLAGALVKVPSSQGVTKKE